MRKKPFIGILLENMQEVREVFRHGMEAPANYDYLVGVAHRERGDVFPKIAAHRAVYMGDARQVGSKEIVNNLELLPTCNTLFFDSWPNPGMLDFLKNQRGSVGKDVGVVVNLTDVDIELAENSPGPIARRLATYGNTVDYVCFNGGGRLGADYIPEFARMWVSRLRANNSYGVCVSGNFCEANVERLRPLLKEFPDTSVIAGRRLRGADGTLDVDRARRYLRYAGELYDQYLVAA